MRRVSPAQAIRSPRPAALFVVLCAALASTWFSRHAAAQLLHSVNIVGIGSDMTCMGGSHRNPNVMMIGTADGQILRTEDNGATWQAFQITPSRTMFYGRERSDTPNTEYGGSWPGKSAQMRRWVSKGWSPTAYGVGVLIGKGEKPASVNWIEVDWNDENIIYVGTSDGLYLSRDRARSFVRIFQGECSISERAVNAVAVNPADSSHLLVGTNNGMYISYDRGATFRKTMDRYMRESYIREIWFDPNMPGIVHVPIGGAAMASTDGGRNWITTHWDEYGPRGDVQSFSFGPQKLRLIGTRDGVLASWQGGEMGSWQWRGGRFFGTAITKVVALSDPKIWLALTDAAVWVTGDSGNNWRKIFQFGGGESPRWMTALGGDPRQLWVLTNRQLYRMGDSPLLATGPSAPRYPRSLLEVPPLDEFLVQVLKQQKVFFPDVQGYRNRGAWSALLPEVSFGAHYATALDVTTYIDYMQGNWPYRTFNTNPDKGVTFELFATWELGRLLFDKRELPHTGRVDRALSSQRKDMLDRAQRLYQEYIRVARILVDKTPADQLVREFHEIRLQEITAYLDGVTGGYWSKNTRGVP